MLRDPAVSVHASFATFKTASVVLIRRFGMDVDLAPPIRVLVDLHPQGGGQAAPKLRLRVRDHGRPLSTDAEYARAHDWLSTRVEEGSSAVSRRADSNEHWKYTCAPAPPPRARVCTR